MATTSDGAPANEAGQAPNPGADTSASRAESVPANQDHTGQTEPAQFSVPDKFVGKPTHEIITSYTNLESEHGKTKEEIRQLRERAERLENQNLQYQSMLNETRTRREPEHSVEDPFQEITRKWDDDPLQATLTGLQTIEERVESKFTATQAAARYEQAKNDGEHYPGFKELEPKMIENAQRLARYVNPKYVNSPEMVDLLYKVTLAENGLPESVMNQVNERVRVEQEKNAATMEGASTTKSVNLNELSLAEMREAIGVSRLRD